MLVVVTLSDGGNTRSRCQRWVIAEMPKLSKQRGTVSTVVKLVV